MFDPDSRSLVSSKYEVAEDLNVFRSDDLEKLR
jgi:hypothetical protein